jgi:hypothetical protein
MNTLIGRKDVDNALQKLDRLTQEESQLMIARTLELTHRVEQSAQLPPCRSDTLLIHFCYATNSN